MLRPILLIIAFWAFSATPVLCTAGVLAHACQCSDDQVEACDHEADCDMDPCSEQILRKDEASGGFAADAGHIALDQCTVSPGDVPLVECPDHSQSAPSGHTPPLGVPHASDLPLLI